MQTLHGDLKTVLITGVTGDIGSAIALKFAQQGWNILGQYHSSKNKIKELKKTIKQFNVECAFFQADFCSEKQVTQLISNLKKYKVNSLVNNAGGICFKKTF